MCMDLKIEYQCTAYIACQLVQPNRHPYLGLQDTSGGSFSGCAPIVDIFHTLAGEVFGAPSPAPTISFMPSSAPIPAPTLAPTTLAPSAAPTPAPTSPAPTEKPTPFGIQTSPGAVTRPSLLGAGL